MLVRKRLTALIVLELFFKNHHEKFDTLPFHIPSDIGLVFSEITRKFNFLKTILQYFLSST